MADPALLQEAARRGLLSPQDQALFEEAARRGLVERPEEPSFGEKFADFFTGDLRGRGLRPELGSLTGVASEADAAALGLGFFATPSAQARVNMLRERIPDAQFFTDTNENIIVRLPDGREAFLNEPGGSLQDIADLGSEALKFLPGAKAASAFSTVPRRLAVGGAAAGATSVLEDLAGNQLGGNTDIDVLRAAITAATGAGAELIGPLIGRISALAKGVPLIQDGVLTPAGKSAISSVGLNPSDISTALAEGVASLGTARLRPGVAGTAALSESFDLPLTRGQATQDFGQIAQEEALRSSGLPGGDIVRAFDDRQNARLVTITTEVQEDLARTGGGPGLKTLAEGGEQIIDEVTQEAGDLLTSIDDAYANVRGRNAAISREGLDTLGDVRSSLAERGFEVDEALFPATAKSLDKLEGLQGREINQKTITELEQTRRVLIQNAKAAKTPADATAAGLVIKRYDEFLDEAFDNALFQGDEEVLDLLKKARGLRSEFAGRFQERTGRTRSGKTIADPGGRAVESILQRNPTDEGVVNMIFGRGRLFNDQNAVQVVRAIKAATANSPSTQAVLRQLAFRRIMSQAMATGAFSPQKFVTAFDTVMRESPTLMKEIFNGRQIARMREFRNLSKLLIPPPKAINPAGTAGALRRAKEGGIRRRVEDAFISLAGAVGLAKGGLRGGAIGRQVGAAGIQAQRSGRSVRQARRAVGEPFFVPGRPDDFVISSIIALARGDPDTVLGGIQLPDLPVEEGIVAP